MQSSTIGIIFLLAAGSVAAPANVDPGLETRQGNCFSVDISCGSD